MRVADIIAYVNHDIDDATRAGLLKPEDLPREPVAVLGATSSARIATLVKDVVERDAGGGADRNSDEPADCSRRCWGCAASCSRRSTRTAIATAEFKKASDILSGLWEKMHERPGEFLDPRMIEKEGIDAAARDFVAGMTDRYAVRLFEQLFIPKPWAIE